jgi:hypothetical protein
MLKSSFETLLLSYNINLPSKLYNLLFGFSYSITAVNFDKDVSVVNKLVSFLAFFTFKFVSPSSYYIINKLQKL